MEKNSKFSLVTFLLSILIVGLIIPFAYSQPHAVIVRMRQTKSK